MGIKEVEISFLFYTGSLTKMEVSVIIPTYNRKRFVKRAVASVLYQEEGGYEVIVVDDGSTDSTREALSIFGNRIRYVLCPANKGVSFARNIGIKLSRYPLIAFLDSDDYWLPQEALFSDMLLQRKSWCCCMPNR